MQAALDDYLRRARDIIFTADMRGEKNELAKAVNISRRTLGRIMDKNDKTAVSSKTLFAIIEYGAKQKEQA
jgi:DNA-binding Xre family transcriptional regulator